MSKNETAGKKLNFWDCMGFCIGQIIGSGIMVLTGIVIGLTGHGTPFAFIGAGLLALTINLPSAVLASAIPSSGAGYAYIKKLIHEKLGFFYLLMFVVTQVLIATFAKGFADYFVALVPGASAKAVALIVLCVALGINFIGLKTSARVQNIMVAFLLGSLFLFIVFGLPKVEWSNFVVTKANIMPNGILPFLNGIALLSFATGGAKFIAENGDDVENPGKNIPKAMILSTSIVVVFYFFLGVVASGILPVETVAFQPLTLVAQEIFPPALYIFFIVGGAMFALMTTLNGTLSWVTRGLQRASLEGWLPEWVGKENKGGAPVFLLIVFGIVGALPIIFNMDTEMIANMGVGLDMLCEFIVLVACFFLPTKFPKEFKNAHFTFSKPVYYTILIISGILMLGTSYVNLMDLSKPVYIAIGVYLVFAFTMTQICYKRYKIKNPEIERAKAK